MRTSLYFVFSIIIIGLTILLIGLLEDNSCSGQIGFWVIPEHQVATNNSLGDDTFYSPPLAFAYDGQYAMVRFFSKQSSVSRYLKLKAKHVEADLFYMHPSGRWYRLASFNDVTKRFEVLDGNIK